MPRTDTSVVDASGCLLSVARAVAAGDTVVIWCGVGQPRHAAAQSARYVSEQLVAASASDRWRIGRSATDGLAAVAVSAIHNVGIDVQHAGRDSPTPAELQGWLHPDERSDCRPGSPGWEPADVWSRKEAVLKVLGVGLAVGPEQVSAGPRSIDWRCVNVPRFSPVRVRSLDPPGDTSSLAAALAVDSAGDVNVSLISWPD